MGVVSYEQFKALEIRIGTITVAERVEGADRLLRLEVDLGFETRQLAAGIAEWYTPQELIGRQVPVLCNLEPRTIRGIESHGMMLAAGSERAYLLHPDQLLQSGEVVR